MIPEVDLHIVNLRAPGWRDLDDILSLDERARRDGFIFEPDRQAFTLCRAALRQHLGAALGAPPRELRFRLGPQGKPHLVEGARHFNVSHSKDLGLIAITQLPHVGVDIEHERPLDDLFALARRHFSIAEQETLRQLPEALQTAGFFLCWSRKEAFIKAIGRGLSFPLDRFDVSLDPREPARLLALRGEEYIEQEWTLQAPSIASGYRAALVTPSPASARIHPVNTQGGSV